VTRRRRPDRDRGAFTAEFAVGLPALMAMLLLALSVVSAAIAKMQCIDAARSAAIAAARGESGAAEAAGIAPEGADIRVAVGADAVSVAVSSRVPVLGASLPLITVHATAVAAREPSEFT
jgi:Flp pilus assembly protein TadG